MRRSICYTEPPTALAGEYNTWKFIYTSSISLPKGTRLKFDSLSKGRDIDWELPSTNYKKGSNVIYAQLENGKVVPAKEIELADSLVPNYEFILPSELEAGSTFVIIMGAYPSDDDVNEDNGNRAQCNSQRRRTFLLSIDPAGKGNYGDPEVFSLDIKGNILKNIRILTPSFVARNKRFDVIVRFEDEFGNLTNNAPADTLIELSHEHLRENLNWKLFVPETGFISLPNLYFNEPGIYTIKLFNRGTKEYFRSPPIKCFQDNNKHLFWGLLHGESERIDSTENIESCLRHMRDEKALNFFTTSPFENQEETSNETWKLIVQNAQEFDESDRFVTYLGFQWQGIEKEEGVRHFIYTKDHKSIFRKKDPKYSSLKKIYKSFSPKELISIPTFTMGEGFEFDFSEFNPEFERVVEIYNAWGSSECTKKEGNHRPIQIDGKVGVHESREGSVQNALLANCRFGFVGGGLDDRGIYSDFFEGDQVQYSPGATGIIAPEHTRSSLAEALYNRHCYATTGERIILGIEITGAQMGSEISSATKPGLLINRHISGYVAGTCPLKSVEIIRNGKVIKTFSSKDYFLEFTFDDLTPLSKVAIDNKDKKPPFVYYYLRVIQEDGHMAWSSPIWVDLLPPLPVNKEAKKAQKSLKKPIIEDFDEEEEEEEDEDDYDIDDIDDEDDE